MTCGEARARLEAFVDGELEAEPALTLRHHLDGCSACAGEHRAAATLAGRLAALPAPPPVDLAPAVIRRVSARRGSGELSAALLAAEAILACLILVQLGLDGLLAAAAASLHDGGALLAGQTANPAAADLGLVFTLLLLVAVSIVHLGLLGAWSRRSA